MPANPLTSAASAFALWMDGHALSYRDIRVSIGASHTSVWRWRKGGVMERVYAKLLAARWPDAPLNVRPWGKSKVSLPVQP